MPLAQQVADAVAQVAPIHGVSLRDPTDKATWRIDFKDEATEQDRAAASAAVASFGLSQAAQVEGLTERLRAKIEKYGPRLLAALAIRASSGWLTGTTAGERNQLQSLIDEAAAKALTEIRSA